MIVSKGLSRRRTLYNTISDEVWKGLGLLLGDLYNV